MEIISRKIELSEFKSFFDDKSPSVKDGVVVNGDGEENYGNYGAFPVDFYADYSEDDYSIDISLINLPFVEGENGKMLRYSTMMYYYFTVMKIIERCRFVFCCGNDVSEVTDIMWGEKKTNRERFFDERVDELLIETPEEPWNEDNFKCVSESLYFLEDIFNIDGSTFENWRKYVGIFLEYVERVRGKKTVKEENYSVPFVEIPIFIEESYKDNGVFTPVVEEWKANKKYYIGENVYYDRGVYTLTDIDAELGYYSGYYDEEKMVTYFDDIDEDGKLILNHWTKNIETEEEIIDDISGSSYNKVSMLRSERGAYDIFSKKLPFSVLYTENGYISALQYVIDYPKNTALRDDIIVGDYIKGITLYDAEGKNTVKTFSNEIVTVKSEEEDFSAETNAILTEGIEKDEYIIKFNYVLGAELEIAENEMRIKSDTGIEFTEYYKAELKEGDFYYGSDEETVSFTYLDIDYGKPLSNATFSFKNGSKKKETVGSVPLIKEEYRMNSAKIISEGDVYVERGTSAALERHHILSEVNTLEDLEEYKNNYFYV